MTNHKHQLSKSYIREKLHRGVLLGQVADKLGVTTSFLSMLKSERSSITVPLDKIVAFAQACPGVDPATLLILRLREELGEPEMKLLWACSKLLDLMNSSDDEIHDACVQIARSSHDCDAQLEKICEEERNGDLQSGLGRTRQ